MVYFTLLTFTFFFKQEKIATRNLLAGGVDLIAVYLHLMPMVRFHALYMDIFLNSPKQCLIALTIVHAGINCIQAFQPMLTLISYMPNIPSDLISIHFVTSINIIYHLILQQNNCVFIYSNERRKCMSSLLIPSKNRNALYTN